jgi:two-component system response regulator YesN
VITEFFTRINLMIREKRDSVNKQMIDEIRRYLEENYASEITLSAIAAQYRISPGYLSLLFTECTGENFIDYLTECRISKAMELLKHTKMRIYEIANAVGYNDPFYFSTCFKKITKKTPSEYREELCE